MKRLILIAASFGMAASANAATISGGSFSNPESTTEINQSGDLNLFDSTLGPLTGAVLTLTGSATFSFTGANNTAQALTATLTSFTNLVFTSSLAVPNALLGDIDLSATSGSQTYAVGETKSFGPINDTKDSIIDLAGSLAVLQALGGGTFSINCASLSGLSVLGGGGNILTTQATTAGCGASILYTYRLAPAQIVINDAGNTDNQSATAGTAVTTPPSVIVLDANDNPVAGADVTFAVASGGGAVDPTTPVAADANGIATVNSWTLGATAGTNTLTATITGSDPAVSTTFTATGTAPLELAKTAAGSYDRTVSWQLAKTASPSSHTGAPGDDFLSNWTVTATRSEIFGNYAVTGTITVTNPNSFDVPFSLADVLDDGTVAIINCPITNDNTGTALAGGSVICGYEAAPTDGSATLNTATVTFDLGAGSTIAEGTAAVSFAENLIGDDSVTLSDPRVAYSQLISGTTIEIFPETFTCPADSNLYTDGVYTQTFTNTAFLDGSSTDLEASAEVTITCTQTAPVAPGNVSATAGNAQATVSWKEPTDDGGAPITGYTVTGVPDGSCSVAGDVTECTITGLTNGTAYTFTVIATNAQGNSLPSVPSNTVVPSELLFRDRFEGD